MIFSTLYTTLPHNLIKEKLIVLTERTFHRVCSLYLACNDRNAFFTSDEHKKYTFYGHAKRCMKLSLFFWVIQIYIRFGRQIAGIPMGTNCASLVAVLFSFCYERDFMLSLSAWG